MATQLYVIFSKQRVIELFNIFAYMFKCNKCSHVLHHISFLLYKLKTACLNTFLIPLIYPVLTGAKHINTTENISYRYQYLYSQSDAFALYNACFLLNNSLIRLKKKHSTVLMLSVFLSMRSLIISLTLSLSFHHSLMRFALLVYREYSQ